MGRERKEERVEREREFNPSLMTVAPHNEIKRYREGREILLSLSLSFYFSNKKR